VVKPRNDPIVRITLSSGVEVTVRIGLIKPKGVKEPKIVKRDENGDLILRKRMTDTGEMFNKFSWVNVDMNGNPYEPEKITDYEVLSDGTEVVLKYPPRTQSLKFKEKLPVTYAGRLLPKQMYEIYSEDMDTIMALYEELEYAIDNDIMYYVSPFVWKAKTKKQYYALFMPYRTKDDKFGWTMTTCEGSIEYKHAMEIDLDIEEKTELKTIGSLEALLEI